METSSERSHSRRSRARALGFSTPAIIGYAALALAGAARADNSDLIQPYYDVKVYVNDGTSDGGTIEKSSSTEAVSVSLGGATSEVLDDDGGTLTSSLDVEGTSGVNSIFQAQASFNYALQLIPLSPNEPTDVTVPVHLIAYGTAHTYSDGYDFPSASAEISITQNGLVIASDFADKAPGTHYPLSFKLDQFVDLSADSLVYVHMQTMTQFTTEYGSQGQIGATVDPTFTIEDPYFAARYKIVGIPQGANPPPPTAVPEPASWALMLAGFGLTGLAVRGRRRVAA